MNSLCESVTLHPLPRAVHHRERHIATTIDIHDIEHRLWASADELRANSGLKESEYSVPVLGLIFLKYADSRFAALEAELAGQATGRRRIGKEDYQARGVLYLPPPARFGHLLALPEGVNLGQAVNDAMKAIEEENEELRGVLPRSYTPLTNATLATLIRNVNTILGQIDGDGFGKVYEYFLGDFARAEGQRGGQFFTPAATFSSRASSPARSTSPTSISETQSRRREGCGRRASLVGA